MTDTGQSCLSGPAVLMNYIGDTLLSLIENIQGEDLSDATFDCGSSNNLPSFYLLYGDYWFEVRREDYVAQNTEGKCFLCLTADEGNEWILGDVFMRGWYNIHDHDNRRFGFAPFKGSGRSPP